MTAWKDKQQVVLMQQKGRVHTVKLGNKAVRFRHYLPLLVESSHRVGQRSRLESMRMGAGRMVVSRKD